MPKEIFDAVQDTNVQGAANVARVVLPIFRRQQHGHLVLLGSVVGDIAVPGMTAYVVSKHAIRSFGRQLALENRDLSEVHITVEPTEGNVIEAREDREAVRGGENQGFSDLFARVCGR